VHHGRGHLTGDDSTEQALVIGHDRMLVHGVSTTYPTVGNVIENSGLTTPSVAPSHPLK
jgi:hypothetical protein